MTNRPPQPGHQARDQAQALDHLERLARRIDQATQRARHNNTHRTVENWRIAA